MKAVGAHLDVSQLKLIVDFEKLKLKKLPNPSKEFVGSGFKMYTSKMVEISPGATVLCGVVHVPVACDEIRFVNTKAGLGLLFNVFKQSNQDSINYSLSLSIRLNCLLLSNTAISWIFASCGNC